MKARRALTVAILGALALGLASPQGAGSGTKRHPRALVISNLTLPSGPLREGTPGHGRNFRTLRSSTSPPTPYLTPDGLTVYISFSDLYTPDPTVAQSFANFLGFLTHGPELNGLYVYIVTPAEIAATCGDGASACWRADSAIPTGYMIVTGEADPNGIPTEQAVAHELGHHIAFHRENPPWEAIDFGPKRWANHMNVCANAARGQLFPGAEPPDPHYPLNPGEGWAEDYRAMNEIRAGGTWPPIGWVVVDPFFIPDAAILALVQRDVTSPWSGPTPYAAHGKLFRRGVRRYTMRPYDGPMTASVSGRPGTTVAFAVGGRIARGPARRISGLVCGATKVTVVVRSKKGGKFTLHVTEDDN